MIPPDGTMKVAMYYRNTDVRIEEMPIPKIGPEEVLVKVKACGICGSDVMEWYRIKTAPRVLGHEMTGIIAKVGSNVKGYNIGDRVFVSHHVPCNTCHYCLKGHHSACHTLQTTNFYPGGFAEYLRVPKINVDRGIFILPESMSFEQGTFIEPLACVFRSLRQCGFMPGDHILIIGSGISGLLHIKLASALGAGKIIATDINPYRMKRAKEFGADIVIDAKEDVPSMVKDALNGRGADIVVLCTGAAEAIKHAISSVDRGGCLMFFAPPNPGIDVSIPMADFWRKEISIKTSYAGAPYDITKAIELISTKRVMVDDMITHVLPLEKAQMGFNLVASAKESIKVILRPHMED